MGLYFLIGLWFADDIALSLSQSVSKAMTKFQIDIPFVDYSFKLYPSA